MARVLTLGLCLLLLGTAACGDDSEDADPVSRLPENASGIASVDFDRARRALDLDEDFDFSDVSAEDGDSEERLSIAGGLVFPYLSPSRPVPLRAALDHSQMAAAATAGGSPEETVTVVATEQSLDDLADELDGRGYRRRGELLVSNESSADVVYPAVGEADGVLVMGGSEKAVRDALGREDGGGEAAELLDTLGEPPVRAVTTLSGPCVRGLGISDELQPARGEVLIFTDGDADSDAVRFEETFSSSPGRDTESIELEDPDIDGDLVSIEYGYEDAEPAAGLTTLLRSRFGEKSLYDC